MADRSLTIFIGSASEGLEVATAVRNVLARNPLLKPRVWNEGTARLSMTVIESLEAELDQCDFAVLTLTADDLLESRGELTLAPRDNVLFELGLFMGRLGRERAYLVCNKDQKLKLPSDLLGVTAAIYTKDDDQDLEAALARACSSMAKRMTELGIRLKRTPEAVIQARLVSQFCVRICGSWWGRQWSQEEQRLALFRISAEGGLDVVQIDGDTFDSKGQLFGRWKSVATGVDVIERKLFFSWEGSHPTLAPGETYKGFGQYTFKEVSGVCEEGDGLFADIQVGRKRPAVWKAVELRRVNPADLDRVTQVMKTGTDHARAAEVLRALATFTGLEAHGT
jgi:hypothetical protein